MLNVAVVMGRLVAEPELRHTPSDVAVTSFALAVDRAYVKAGTERQADFIDCVAWRNTAEFICKHFRKGQMMAIKGSIQTRTYTSGSDDSKRKATEIMVSDVSFCGSKRESEGGNYSNNSTSSSVPPQQGTYASAAPFIEPDDNPVFASDEYEPIKLADEDLPF